MHRIPHHFIYHYDVVAFNALSAKIFRLIEEIHADRFGKAAKIELCVNDLMLHINRAVYEAEHPAARKDASGLYDGILQYIESHLDEDLSLDSLSKAFFVSKYHISHIFKDNFGISIHQYITKKRLSMCRDAILSNENITKIYLMYGFKDYTSFFVHSKRVWHLTQDIRNFMRRNRSRIYRSVLVFRGNPWAFFAIRCYNAPIPSSVLRYGSYPCAPPIFQ
mgnify:CR=1 FL=1